MEDLCGKRILTLFVGIIIFVVVFFLDSLQLVGGPLFFNIAILYSFFSNCQLFLNNLFAQLGTCPNCAKCTAGTRPQLRTNLYLSYHKLRHRRLEC